MSLRSNQVESVLHRAVQQVLSRGLNDPRVRGLVSVTAVSVSDDLANATIGVSVIPEDNAELALHGLRHAARHVRMEVGNLVRMRRVPELRFRLDASLKKQAAIDLAIREVGEETEDRRP